MLALERKDIFSQNLNNRLPLKKTSPVDPQWSPAAVSYFFFGVMGAPTKLGDSVSKKAGSFCHYWHRNYDEQLNY